MSFTYCISTTHNGTLVVHEGDTCPLCDALAKPKLKVKVGYRYKQRDGRVIDITKDNVCAWLQSGYKTSVCIPQHCDIVEELGPTYLAKERYRLSTKRRK